MRARRAASNLRSVTSVATSPRTILHVDMDAFYASVEVRDAPQLRGLPLIVGGHPTRGVVLTCSYEARKFGVRSAMSMVEARQRCPEATVVPPRGEAYAEASSVVFEVLHRYTPLVEGLSLDEAFLDVTASSALFGDGVAIGTAIKRDIREATRGLSASVGVAACKFVAKVASDLKKPDALVVCPVGGEAAFLAPLGVERIWGVGPKTAESLRARGLRTIADLQSASLARIAAVMGEQGAAHVQALAFGRDVRDVETGREAKSIGSESTFDRDRIGPEPLHEPILRHCEEVARRLRAEHLVAGALVLKVKRHDHTLVTRRSVSNVPLCEARELYALALELLERVGLDGVRTRLVGVSATALRGAEPVQRELFSSEPTVARPRQLGAVIDAIAERFGEDAIKRAGPR
ncbi:MAG: DNA polymerase IV [Polyangiales bacterium]